MTEPRSSIHRLLSARWPRVALDLGWYLSFGVFFTLLLLRAPSGAISGGIGGAVKLSLVEGVQRQALYRDGQRLGLIFCRVEQRARGWRVLHRFVLGQHEAGQTRIDLRRDLSLDRLSLDLDMTRMGQLSGLPGVLRAGLRELRRIRVDGRCSAETGDCEVRGKVGPHELQQTISAGRGPVVTSAIYPLLAQGSLGRRVEVRIFDPLSLGQRLVTFQVEGRERLRLHSGTFEAIRISRDLEALTSRVWIDAQGRVLKEELPLGMVVEHEAWTESAAEANGR